MSRFLSTNIPDRTQLLVTSDTLVIATAFLAPLALDFSAIASGPSCGLPSAPVTPHKQ
jgi:hypothetical protein